MLKAFKYRIYPTTDQEDILNKHLGAVRFIYNLALETKTYAYASAGVNLSRYDLQVQAKELKKDCEWLKEINSQSIQVALMNLDAAYLKFFKGLGKFPVFKKKSHGGSFNCPQRFKIVDDKLFIPKITTGIKIVLSRQVVGEMRNVTISKTPTGKYFASILVNDGIDKIQPPPIKRETALGVDLGIKTFAVCSDGTNIENPKYLNNALKRLNVLQRRLSRKKKGSKNRNKARRKVALQHEKIANQRKDFLHKASNSITKNYDTLCFENLRINNMVKNHKLAKSISDAGWGVFTQFVKYKCAWRGKNYLEIGTFEPSSKMHNTCGYIYKELNLSERVWTCPKCHKEVDRDANAALNIMNFAIINSGGGIAVEPVELSALAGAMKQEVSN